MGRLLFSPEGQITPAQFMKAAQVLVILSILIKAMPLASVKMASIFNILMIPLSYCWIAIFMKRYRYAGQSAWMCLVPVAVYVVSYFIISAILPMFFGGEPYRLMQAELMDAMQSGGGLSRLGEIGALYGPAVAHKLALPSALAYGGLSLAIAYFFNQLISSPNA